MTRELLELDLQLTGALTDEQRRTLVTRLSEEIARIAPNISFAGPCRDVVRINALLVRSDRANYFKGQMPRRD